MYEDGLAWQTIHINHAKPARHPAAGFPAPIPTPEPPRKALGYLQRSLQRPLSRQPPPPPQSAAPAGGSPSPPASSKSTSPAVMPSTGRRLTRGPAAANRNSASRSSKPPPPASARANDNARSSLQPRRSARLNPQAYAIKSALPAPAPLSLSNTMAQTYPLSLPYNQCLGSKEDPYSFSSVYIEDLRNGDTEYLTSVQQLIDAIPKTLDPASRFALRGQVTPSGHQRLCHSMRAALWWLLPSDGDFRRPSSGLQYYLARQGRRVVLRGGDVTQPLYESRMNWVHDPAPPASHRPIVDYDETPASPLPVNLRELFSPSHSPRSPGEGGEEGTTAQPIRIRRTAQPPQWPRMSAWPMKIQHPERDPTQVSGQWPPQDDEYPVYQSFHSFHLPQHPIPTANENSAFQFGLDHCGIPGVYKPAQPDPRQDLTATLTRDNISGFGLSSPSLPQPCTKPFSGLLGTL